MVNGAVTPGAEDARAAERALAVGYAPAAARAGLAALLALDHRLGGLVAGTREPMVAQMRLTWWHEALCALDAAPPPAEPVLAAIAREIVSRGTMGSGIAAMVDGWELLLDGPPGEEGLARFARERGARLFAIAALLLGRSEAGVAPAGEGWALADLARRSADPAVAARASALARARLDVALARRWPRPLRPLGALALLARADLAGAAPGSPRRVARLLWHRLTGG